MTHVCRQCSRVNPPEAAFCYWDGALLTGGRGGPIDAGSAPFPSQFVFPGGQVCRNFDQLAIACQQNWQAAVELLRQGFFTSFLGAMGRADLAMTARAAASFPDADRGLDQLLARLPTQVLEPPKVAVEPSMVNLGIVPMGSERKLDLHLSNLGMRLAYGSVVSDCKWLSLGEGPAASRKLFQFGAETIIPVHVKGKFLRAGNQPLEGRLLVDSSGGTVTVTVRADVPIAPFPDGLLAGAHTPRQIAEKARAYPKEAAVLFEKGLVAKWFTTNGWTYPVQGPAVAGLGGIQQFFEALGLAKAPKVQLRTPSVSLRGDPGQALKAAIDVATSEKKHVFAFAMSNRPWVVPGIQPLQEKNPTGATIPLTINVPGTPGQVLQAKVTVTANGNQRFVVPVTLTVSGAPGDYVLAQAIPLPTGAAAGSAVPIMATPMTAIPVDTRPVAPFANSRSGSAHPLIDVSTYHNKAPSPWVHLLPLGALTLVLIVVMLRDLLGTPPEEIGFRSADIDPTPRLKLYFDYGGEKGLRNSMTFGLLMVDAATSQDTDPKRLTFDPFGRTNSTVVSIDGHDKMFGFQNHGKYTTKPALIGDHDGRTVTFQFTPDPIYVTQSVKIVPGEAIEVTPGVFKRPLDTCLIKYKIENNGSKAHKIGLRMVVNTLIGKNDGTPFTIPGLPGLVATLKDMRAHAEIPDFIQALEFPDLEHPGTVVQMNLKLSDALAPDRVSLTHWPGHDFGRWDVPLRNIADDSAIVLYWNPIFMKPGESREMAFSYGLGNLRGGKLGLTIGGTLAVHREMTVVAYVANPQPGETATLKLPDGFEFLDGSTAAQPVPAAERGADGKLRPSPVTWRVRPLFEGRHTLTVNTSTNLSVAQAVTIRKKGIF